MESGNSVMSVSEVHSVVSNHANAWSKNTGNSILSVLSDNGVVTVESAMLADSSVSLVMIVGMVSSAKSDTLQNARMMNTIFFI